MLCAGCSWPGGLLVCFLKPAFVTFKSLRINRIEIWKLASVHLFIIFSYIKIEALCSPNLQQSK